MNNPRFSFEEFKALVPDRFESQDKLLSEYRSFLTLLDQVDRVSVPELSAGQKAEVFRRSWQGRSRDRRPAWSWLGPLRRPAVTFAMGIVLGCSLMFVVARGRAAVPQPASPQQSLAVEHAGYTQIYTGKIVKDLYPQIENPKIVIERPQRSSAPQRVLYGTLDEGETYVVWNL
jgi:hypothetical protein